MNSTTTEATDAGDIVFKTFLLLISVPLVFLTIAGNILVLLTWTFHPPIRSPSNAYLVSLATADLITGLLAFPLTVHYSYVQTWIWGLGVCRVWLVLCFALYSITAFHLVAIAVDRYRIITEGVQYIQRRTMKSVGEKLVLIWMLGLWVTIPVILDWEHISKDPTAQKHCVSKKIPYWVAHYCCSSFWFPAFFMGKMYFMVYREIRMKLRNKVENGEHNTPRTELSSDRSSENEHSNAKPPISEMTCGIENSRARALISRERRTALTVVIISSAFVFCWLPWNVLSLYDVLSIAGKPTPHMYMFSAIFGLANSCMNPIVYAARMPDFQNGCKKIFKIK